ncbi:MAG: translation initiation factor IF-2 [Proteobacteria bacterium]|nr:MAG: translation initiation factor IF-2 [Pseudomonadota bacterium]
MNAQRTGIGGGAIGAGARRVQYDPRAGAGAARGGPMRPGMFGRGMMGGRGGPGGFRGRPIPGQLRPRPQVSTKEMSEHKKLIRIEENITLQSMAAKMSLKATELMMKIFSLGMTNVHINTSLDADTAKLLANEFGWEVEDVAVSEEASMAAARGETPSAESRTEDMELRAPVVTVMGHVDHGKTSLLDRIRKSAVASGEAGGITQHIGAYKVQTAGGTVVFLDTPGHEAFSQMRARGASVTDIVILVVAADDGVMPQTKEAVAHAKAAKVPIIVAVNKIDKPGAEPERARRELVELGLQPEEWGGDTIFVNVSAQTGEGIESLLEMIHLQSEILDLRADSTVPARGTVIEALLDRGRGPVARILVQEGTLRVGDFVLAGAGFGKIRAMTNEHGKAVQTAGPSTPVEILGLSDVPGAGDPLDAVKDAKKAQEIAETRKGKLSKSMIPASAKVSLEELSKRMSDSGQQELRVIIKGDVQGSVEAVSEALSKLTGEKARLLIIHAAVGAITEGDINLAVAARAVIVGFNVKPAGKSAALADENKIEIRLYTIIYQAVDDVRAAMEGLLPSTYVEEKLGQAEVRVVYTIRNRSVAGCYVIQGEIKRNALMRVIRDGKSIHEGKPDQLKRFKEDVKEVKEGFECGITVEGWGDLKESDILESYEMKEVKQKL